jgi:hypothetical protein
MRRERLRHAPVQYRVPACAQISLDHLADHVMREPARISLRLDQEARPAGGHQPSQHLFLWPRDHGDEQRARRPRTYHHRCSEHLSCCLR